MESTRPCASFACRTASKLAYQPTGWQRCLPRSGARRPFTPSSPPRCTSAAHRAFDFWLGEWQVHGANGKQAGTNAITSAHGGCVLRELPHTRQLQR